VKGGALVVQREGMARVSDPWAENPVRQFERPHPVADAARHFVDGKAVGRDRIPNADEFDRGDLNELDLSVRLPAKKHIGNRDKEIVAQRRGQD